MGANLSVKVKAKGKKAADLIKTLQGMPDSSGANFVSRNDLHVDAGAESGKTHSSKRVPYKPRPDLSGKADGKRVPVDTTQQIPEVIGANKTVNPRPSEGDATRQVGQKLLSDAPQGKAFGFRPTSPEGYGPSFVGEGIDTVKPVKRTLNPCEVARMANNKSRDMRTNLGRGKAGQPTVEEGNNVSVTR